MQLDMELLDLSSGRRFVVVGFFIRPFFSIFKCRCEFAFLLFQHSSGQPVRRPSYRTPSEQPSKLPVKFSRKKANFSAIFAAGQCSRGELQLDVLAKGSRCSILLD